MQLQKYFNNTTRIFYLLLGAFTIVFIAIALNTEGTGGSGDSVYHYLYARYSWQNPELFFNHWAKPFFTMLASPFAQFGVMGIKVFNVILSCLACLMAYQTAQMLNLNKSLAIIIFLFGAPLYFKVMLSGLTEPLSAFLLITTIYLWLKGNHKMALILLSFLPFVRSEGLVLLGVFGLFLLYKKQFLLIPWLAAGHVMMSIIGFFYYHDLLWVFNKIPYAHLNSVYGKGNWMHFINQLYFCLGPVIYSLSILGLIATIIELFQKREKPKGFEEKVCLVYGSFMAFFIAHTAFWALGIFNSMGLPRVFVTVFPLLAIMALDGLNFMANLFPKQYSKYAVAVLVIIGCIFPFFKNPASIDFSKDVSLENGQALIKKDIVPYLQQKFPQYRFRGDASIALFSNRNPFDSTVFTSVYEMSLNDLKPKDIFIWDSWFARVEGHMERDLIMNNDKLLIDTIFQTLDKDNKPIEFILLTAKLP